MTRVQNVGGDADDRGWNPLHVATCKGNLKEGLLHIAPPLPLLAGVAEWVYEMKRMQDESDSNGEQASCSMEN